jgi:hypothetical protein
MFNADIGGANRLKMEDERWTEVGSSYNAFRSQVLAELEERRKEFPSAKAKGKQRLDEDNEGEGNTNVDLWDISEQDLPEHFQGGEGLDLARSIVKGEYGKQSTLNERIADLEWTVSNSYFPTGSQLTRVVGGPFAHPGTLGIENNSHSRNRPQSSICGAQFLSRCSVAQPHACRCAILWSPILLSTSDDCTTSSDYGSTRPTSCNVEDRHYAAAGAGG